MADKVKIGFIGAGKIFAEYVEGCRGFHALEIAAVADMDYGRAVEQANRFGIPKGLSVADLLADPDVSIIVNLTVPLAHTEVSLAILEAGKHVYSEKPLAVSRDDGLQILRTAQARGLRVGCAPDTFLGGGQQTCRKLIDDGWIGQPVAAVAFMAGHGPESWHPNPDFYYQVGGGPLFDMGPYYLTSLINLLGPVSRVTGSARISFEERIATSQEHFGRRLPVEVPTHVAGVLDFAAGPVASLITSFDVWSSNLPRIEIYGSEGSLSVPDPNIFGGVVQVRRAGSDHWSEVPLTHGSDMRRGIGVAEMVHAVTAERPQRASGDMAFHVLDIMQSILESSDTGQHVALQSTCDRPAALPTGLLPGTMD